jgi:hypothetical protein
LSLGDRRQRLQQIASLGPLSLCLGNSGKSAMTDREIYLLLFVMLIIAGLLIWGSIRFIDTFVFAALSAPPAG